MLAVYTEMAFGLEWRTAAGRIGPGFFPRIVGMPGSRGHAVVAGRRLRSPGTEDEAVPLEDEVGDADLGKHPRLLVVMVVAAAVFVLTWSRSARSCRRRCSSSLMLVAAQPRATWC